MATVHEASAPSFVKPREHIDMPAPDYQSVENATQHPPKVSTERFIKEEDTALLEANPVGRKFVDPKLRNRNRRGCLKRLRTLHANIDVVDPRFPSRKPGACKKCLARLRELPDKEVPLDCFFLVPSLPLELRETRWKYAYVEPCGRVFRRSRYRPYFHQLVPTLFRVCGESRKVAQKIYTAIGSHD
jgi:hypothetical protein